jgi:DNA-directed RNA polymerase subunit RPC12/RpoP
MADLKFNCPQCSQLISCDELWSGQELQCPTCQAQILVPARPAEAATQASSLVPKPPSSAARLSIGRPQHSPAAATGSSYMPAGNPMARKPAPPPKPKKNPMKIVGIGVGVIALAVGGYFGWNYVSDMQNKANEKRRAAERNADGGEVGHIANLYDALDRTEPGGRGMDGGTRGSGPRARDGTKAITVAANAAPADPGAVDKKAPVTAPAYTLEIALAKIPEGRVNGKISGTNFVADSVRIDATPTAQVLRFTQGTPLSPEKEALIYLHPKPGEKVANHTWSIKQDQRGSDVPQVVKRWKTNPKYAPTSRSFAYGYAMKLELGPATNNAIAGKIYLALPDPEETVIAGGFNAVTVAIDTATASAVATPVAAPDPASTASREAFDKRYGIKK